MNEETTINTTETPVEGQVEETISKTYIEEEVQELLQKEADRRVSAALKKQEKKSAEAIREAQKLAQMNEAEKYQYQLEQREAAIAQKEKELALMENKNEASKILSDKGLSLSLVDFVVAEDAETMSNNIKILETAFKQSVKNEVEKRMSGNTPKKNLPTDRPIDRAAFMKMSMVELQELRANNPDLFNQLSNS